MNYIEKLANISNCELWFTLWHRTRYSKSSALNFWLSTEIRVQNIVWNVSLVHQEIGLYRATRGGKPQVARHLFPACEIFMVTSSGKILGKPKL